MARIPEGPPWPKFGMYLPTNPKKLFYTQTTSILTKLKVVITFWGVIKVHNPINRAHYNSLVAFFIRHNRPPWYLTERRL